MANEKERMELSVYLSASLPPNKLPMAIPKRTTPITDVQVNTELPIIGDIILEATSSIVIRENPAIKEAKVKKFLS